MKLCPRCNIYKGSSGFYLRRASADRLSTYCVECSKLNRDEWRAANQQLLREQKQRSYYRRKYRQGPDYCANSLRQLEQIKRHIQTCERCSRELQQTARVRVVRFN